MLAAFPIKMQSYKYLFILILRQIKTSITITRLNNQTLRYFSVGGRSYAENLSKRKTLNWNYNRYLSAALLKDLVTKIWLGNTVIVKQVDKGV